MHDSLPLITDLGVHILCFCWEKSSLSSQMMSTDELHCNKIILALLLLIYSSDYVLTEKYLINCGSVSMAAMSSRYFVGDVDSGSSSFTVEPSSAVIDDNPVAGTPFLYLTARVFRKQSVYEFQITQDGFYVIRFHFYPFSSTSMNLSHALFNVSASGFSLLSNFSVQTTSNPPVIKEFVIPIDVGKFMIRFTPQKSFFAFVNAVEAFLAPIDFNSDGVHQVTPAGLKGAYNGLLARAFHIIHRINVGGSKITPSEDDRVWATWTPDDEYLFLPNSANNIEFDGTLNDMEATVYSAPQIVYRTAKELSINHGRSSNFLNMTWRFDVNKNSSYFVRVHLCDLISQDIDGTVFNLSIYKKFTDKIYFTYNRPPTPFYMDYVVDSDDSGYLNISVGPHRESLNQAAAFLNGLEIMEIIERSGAYPVQINPNKTLGHADSAFTEPNKTLTSKPKKNFMVAIAGSSVVGVAFALILIGVFIMKRRKTNSVEIQEGSVLLYGGASFRRQNDRTAKSFSVSSLNFNLKIPFSELLNATNNFNPKAIIGQGGFGKVYRGTLRDGKKVAVKRGQPGKQHSFAEFQAEISVLSKIRHRHLVSLIGYCDERNEMILVYEFMEKGTLRDHLYSWNEDCTISTPRAQLSWEKRLEICIGSACGLNYLHTGTDRVIIHRDVKSTNILLDENYFAKVSDFGLSKSGTMDKSHISTNVKGSFGYLDPEYFRCLHLTDKSDVYSFGVVLLEVLCARPAIKRLAPSEEMNLAEWAMLWQKKGQLENIVDPHLLGKINPNSLRKFGETAEKCLEDSSVNRPNMRDVLWDLKYALQLQLVTRHRYGDVITDVSLELPLPIVRDSPSPSFLSKEDDGSETSPSKSFSQFSE